MAHEMDFESLVEGQCEPAAEMRGVGRASLTASGPSQEVVVIQKLVARLFVCYSEVVVLVLRL